MTNPPWWHEAVIYQIYPRSFADSNGDGIGDLDGVIAHLDHLVDLGVNTVWLSPFFASPQADFGYDISDYCSVAPEYGTVATAERLIGEAHQRGLRVLFDLVLNHTSDQHPWFVESSSSRTNARADWYLWRDGRGADGRRPPTNWRSGFEVTSAWQYHEGRGQWYLASFLPFQPDLNWRNPEVVAAMHEVVRFWLSRGVDGFRLDIFDKIMKDPEFRDEPIRPGFGRSEVHLTDRRYTQHHPDMARLTRDLRAVCREFDEPDADGVPTRERVLLGEVFGTPETLRSYLCEGDGLQMVFLFDFLTFRYDASWFTRHIARNERNFAWPDQPTYVLENHDRSRSLDRVKGDLAKGRVLAALQCTLRGVPTIYQGQEIGMTNTYIPLAQAADPVARTAFRRLPEWISRRLPERLNRDEVRTPMQWDAGPNAGFCPPGVTPWLPVNGNAADRNVAVESADPGSLLGWYRTLLHLRASRVSLRSGRLDLLAGIPETVVAYVRSSGAERVLVAANVGAEPVRVPTGGHGELLVHTEGVATDGPAVTLPPNGVAILDLHP